MRVSPSLFVSFRSNAFTLIELLVVVAIISILASIAVPNFLEAQVRAKVARTHADVRSMMVAIESYQVDHNAYPVRRNTSLEGKEVPQLANRLQQLSKLTTPTSYMATIPVDIFEKILPPPNNVLDYWDPVQYSWTLNRNKVFREDRKVDPGSAGYVLLSVGPDGFLGALPNNYGWPGSEDQFGMMYRPYDPTNGTVSPGNVYIGQSSNAEATSARFLQLSQ